MDTIAYLPDPESAAMMLVVIHHLRFTLAHATTSAEAQVQLYDTVDRNNNQAAIKCLLDSMNADLKKRIRNRISDQAAFPVVWLEFIFLVVSSSIDRFEKLKRQIQG
jgi:hypothetical protein